MPVVNQSNVTNPVLLYVPSGSICETVTKYGLNCLAFLGYTRAGIFPAADGNYVAGIAMQDSTPLERGLAIRTIGYSIVRVKAGVAVALDSPIAISTAGEAILSTTGMYTIGRAGAISDGSGTSPVPHYITIKLSV